MRLRNSLKKEEIARDLQQVFDVFARTLEDRPEENDGLAMTTSADPICGDVEPPAGRAMKGTRT